MDDVFKKAAFEIDAVMKEFTEKSKNLNFTSEELEKCYEEYFDEQKGS